MANQAEKALAAIREYDRLMTAIAKNRADIGEGLGSCDRVVWSGGDDFGFGGTSYIPDGKKTHLSEAFEPFDDDDGVNYPRKGYNAPEEIAEIIGDCEGCKRAYAAVLERKANRKALGVIKRSIRAIARAKGGAA